MNEPVRLRNDPATADELRAVLGSRRWSRPMSAEVRARSAAKVDRFLAFPAAVGIVVWLKGIAVAAAIGVGAVGVIEVTELVRHDTVRGGAVTPPPAAPPRAAQSAGPAAPPAAVRAPAPGAPVPTSAPAAVVSPRPAASAPGPLPSAPPVAAPEPPGDSLAREASLLERARASADRDPASALRDLDAHAAAFPSGLLAPERELLAVDVLRRMGRVAEARARGEALVASHPAGLYADRVRAMLGRMAPDAG